LMRRWTHVTCIVAPFVCLHRFVQVGVLVDDILRASGQGDEEATEEALDLGAESLGAWRAVPLGSWCLRYVCWVHSACAVRLGP
jgi:hypothetical protein